MPLSYYFEDERRIFLGEVSEFLPEYTASYTRRQNSL